MNENKPDKFYFTMRTVETINENENRFGIDKVEKAANVIAAMVTHNPHRSLDYFLGIVRTLDR